MTGKHVLLMVLVCSVLSSRAEDNMETLKKRGLAGRVTYRVIDEAGVPVTNASVQVSFQNISISQPPLVLGKTDANGMFTAESRVQYRANTQVRKEGYYRSSHEYTFFTIDQSRMRGGKWLPWNPTIDITLRPRIKPNHDVGELEMYVCHHLEQNTAYGFDMLKKDIVLPGKKGETADFSFKGMGKKTSVVVEGQRGGQIFFTNDFEVVFQNEGDGVIRMKKHLDSEFHFTYLAPETGYLQRLHLYEDFSPQRPEGKGEPFPTDNEYFIFRISRKEEDSNMTKRYYGIITRIGGTADHKGERDFRIWYYLNPDPEDRNIEY